MLSFEVLFISFLSHHTGLKFVDMQRARHEAAMRFAATEFWRNTSLLMHASQSAIRRGSGRGSDRRLG